MSIVSHKDGHHTSKESSTALLLSILFIREGIIVTRISIKQM